MNSARTCMVCYCLHCADCLGAVCKFVWQQRRAAQGESPLLLLIALALCCAPPCGSSPVSRSPDSRRCELLCIRFAVTDGRHLGWSELLLRWIGPLGYSLNHQPVGMWLHRGQLIEQRLVQLLEFPFSETELVTVAADIATCKLTVWRAASSNACTARVTHCLRPRIATRLAVVNHDWNWSAAESSVQLGTSHRFNLRLGESCVLQKRGCLHLLDYNGLSCSDEALVTIRLLL